MSLPITAASVSTTPTASSSASPSAPSIGSNMNTFLTMLTTQLKNQDPTAPMDTNQMTAELVQFSQVEQAITTNSKLDTLIQAQQAGQMVGAVPLVGHSVQYNGNSIDLSNGQAQFSYTIPPGTANADISILNGSGQVVDVAKGDVTAGTHSFTWDGSTTSGKKAVDGTYAVRINATDTTGNSVTTTVAATGKITGVEMQNNQAVVSIDGVTTPISSITSIGN